MQCLYCGNDIPSDASNCPSCGASVPDNVRQTYGPTSPVHPSPVQHEAGQDSAKSLIAYILLGVFLGCLGAHNFYAGYTGKATAQLLITILSCGVAFWIPLIWAWYEISTVNQDAKGVPFA